METLQTYIDSNEITRYLIYLEEITRLPSVLSGYLYPTHA